MTSLASWWDDLSMNYVWSHKETKCGETEKLHKRFVICGHPVFQHTPWSLKVPLQSSFHPFSKPSQLLLILMTSSLAKIKKKQCHFLGHVSEECQEFINNSPELWEEQLARSIPAPIDDERSLFTPSPTTLQALHLSKVKPIIMRREVD